MITNTPKTIIVDGVDATTPVYKRNDSEVVQGQFYVANGDSDKLGAIAITVTDSIVGYIAKPILLHETSVYDITGVATPGDTIIYISSGINDGSIDKLKNNVIASTYADKEGNFKFSNIASSGGAIVMWMTTWAQDTITASLIYHTSIVDYNPNIGKLLTYKFIESENADYVNPLFTITGTCSEDVEVVYVSCTKNVESVTHLMETLCSSTTQSNGNFTINCSGEYNQNYIVWCLSKNDGYMTVSDIQVSNDKSTCLSGDTMITMENGVQKRMDSLCVGDVVLSDGNKSTRIHTIRKGHFSDYHTLYYFDDGTIIDETHPHRFYNVDQGFWQRLQLWNIGDHAINQDGVEVALISVERIEENVEMFGIWTDSGTYYANGLLSGTAACNKELLADASAEQAIDMMLSTDEELLVQLMGLEGVLP